MKSVMIVAGEQSGDILGAGLIRALKYFYPECQFSGIGGERMQAEGFTSYYPIERLSVMGFVEPLKRLPELLGIIKHLKVRFKSDQPDVFIGIDSPDFNIRLEPAAKALGIYSVHYVSPSVWAWRQGRVKKIKKAVDLMLALLPFEADFYRKHDVPVEFVGHPLADELPLEPNRTEARNDLALDQGIPICALLPGSRGSEVEHLLPIMLEAAEALRAKKPDLIFVLPAATEERFRQIIELIGDDRLWLKILLGDSHRAMTAADFVIMASGTTTLEAMLLKRPMIITYKWPKLTWEILKRMVKVPWVGLPNLLCGREIAPELLQDDARAEKIVSCAQRFFDSDERTDMETAFLEHHHTLKKDASQTAARAIIEGWQRNSGALESAGTES